MEDDDTLADGTTSIHLARLAQLTAVGEDGELINIHNYLVEIVSHCPA